MISYVPTDAPQEPQGMPAGMPPEAPMQGPPEMPQGQMPEPAPEMAQGQEPEEPPMDERLAYLQAAMEAEQIVGSQDPKAWANTFKKILQANLVKIPGRQNITVGG